MQMSATEHTALHGAAGSHTSPSTPPLLQEVLSFNLGQEQYGIDILKVQEIRGYTAPTRIAGASHEVKGVMNLRGDVVPIIDLRLKFGLPDAFDDATVTIILSVANRVFGIVVDGVSDVRSLPGSSVKPAPTLDSGAAQSFITGLATLSEGDPSKLLILIDIERLITGVDLDTAGRLVQ